MKTTLRVWVAGVGLLSLMLCAGCEEDKANADVPAFANPTPPVANGVAEPVPPAPSEPQIAVTPAPADAAAAADNTAKPVAKPGPTVAAAQTNATNVVRQPIAPDSVKLTPALAEIVKLAQAGVSEDVLMAYITNSTQLYEIGPNEILYLHDLGVASPVITALIQRDASPEIQARRQAAAAVKPLPPGVGLTTPATNVYPPKVVSQPPEPTPVNPPGEGNGAGIQSGPVVVQQPIVVEQPVVVQEPVTIDYFQSELAPYGSWLDVPGYGSCWRPTVAVCNSSWRPYADHGRWLWSDCGWYWYSDYSWGWAPFHYGRWSCPSGIGWVWVPDTCWGPSWVSWRHTSSHCGWAPLPPSAVFVSGRGFYHNTLSVGINFDFGLPDWHYVFLPFGRFCDRTPYHHYVAQSHARTLYKDSTVINNYIVGNNNTIINRGVGFDRVAKVTRGDIRQVALKDTTAVRDLGPRRERLETDGKTLTVVRPTLVSSKISSPEKPMSAISGIKPKLQTDATAPAKINGTAPSSQIDVNSSSAASKSPRIYTRQPASASAPLIVGADPAAVTKPDHSSIATPSKVGSSGIFKPSSPMHAKSPNQINHSDDLIAKPQDSANAKLADGSTPAGSIFVKPTGPSLKPGNSGSPRSVPSWMDNAQPSAGKVPAPKTKPSVASAQSSPAAAPAKLPSLAKSDSGPTFTQPSGAKASNSRGSESPQPKMSAPSSSPPPSAAPRIQTAPSSPAPVTPKSYTPLPPTPSVSHSHSVPHSAPPSVGKAESSSRSSNSRSSDNDSRKGSK